MSMNVLFYFYFIWKLPSCSRGKKKKSNNKTRQNIQDNVELDEGLVNGRVVTTRLAPYKKLYIYIHINI